ncbi:response regulator [Solimonas sp. K1W22B-7]|uniref:response regulator n=1 Tax=Solimonas sp. K1W22B-7 TaxID=2303331 RepID=UPI000E32E2EB|nr:response regulator [Solimonas sp. K1W22B-7]AXQ30701.1 response regulator [Solimonas sp. K1W22B-7]
MSQATPPRILFVDDEPRILLSLKAIFRNDYEVVTALGGAEGIEQIRKQEFDVIVSDQRMPDVTGVDVLRTARELRPRAVRLLLTGYSDLSAIIGSINEGEIFRFVSKPWANAELRATIAAAVAASDVMPLNLPPPVAVTGAKAAASSVGVLLLDEDIGSRGVLKQALENDRQVYEAGSVDQALSLLEQYPIGVIVTELVVGGEVLTHLLTSLREHHPALVVVVLTAHADAGHSVTLINQGQIYRLLLKPVAESLLRGTINIASRRYEMLRQHPDQVQRAAPEAPRQPVVQPPERLGLLARIKRALRA